MKKSLLAATSAQALHAPSQHAKKPKEPTIALINIVFLLLIFFLAASTLAPPLDTEVKLVNTQLLDNDPPPNALVIRADGSLMLHGEPTSVDAFLSRLKDQHQEKGKLAVRLVPDRQVSAKTLIKVANGLQQGGAHAIKLVTQRDIQHD